MITTPLSEVKHIHDLHFDKVLSKIPYYTSNKKEDETLTSLVLSSQDIIDINDRVLVEASFNCRPQIFTLPLILF